MAEQSQARTAQPTEDAVKPPIPKWIYGILNPIMIALLRSPLHRLLSNAMMVLSFTGRRSGKRYSIPVGYIQKGNQLYIFSHARWWQNLPGSTVDMRLRGKHVRGTARRLEDRHEIAELVQTAIANRGEQMASRMGLTEYADPNASGPLPQRTKFFAITLDEPAA